MKTVILDVTSRIRERSAAARRAYLARVDRLVARPPGAQRMGCANVAHAFAAMPGDQRLRVVAERAPNLAVVTSYNDMLSAHQPYEGYPALIRDEARRAALQSGLFLLTCLAQLVALRDLGRIADVPPAPGTRARPGLREVARALVEAARFRVFFRAMWLLCMAAAAALFAVYLFQSPLSRLTRELAQRAPLAWPLYTLVAMGGYWACARGSHAARLHHHDTTDEALWPSARWQTALSLGLLVLYPLLYGLVYTARPVVQAGVLLVAAAIICLLFNFARGFNEPYSATALIAFTERHGHAVPASVISGFNSLKRGAHFLLSAVFFLAQRGPSSIRGLRIDARLALTLAVLALCFALALVPAVRRPRLDDAPR